MTAVTQQPARRPLDQPNEVYHHFHLHVSTYAMVERMLDQLEVLVGSDTDARYAALRWVRGDWSD